MTQGMPDIHTVMGFDYGERRIGIATGQTITGTAAPLVTLQCPGKQPDWNAIAEHIRQWKPDALIVGMPYYLDGSSSDMTRKAEVFVKSLAAHFDLPVFTVNENLSSYEAEQLLNQRQVKIGQHNKQELDKMAAAVIVQSWLEQNS